MAVRESRQKFSNAVTHINALKILGAAAMSRLRKLKIWARSSAMMQELPSSRTL
jgi:hypothetical protein